MAHVIVPPTTHEPMPERRPRNSKAAKMLFGLTFLVGGMFAFAFFNAQFFIMLCEKVGLITPSAESARGAIVEVDGGRPIDVYFSAHVNDNLPIAFTVRQRFMRTETGRRAIVDYRFVNLSNEVIYFRPVHDVFPIQAGRENILTLEECFCFTEQRILPGESYTLPVVFSFSHDLPDNITVIRKSYSLHRSTRQAWERAMASLETEGAIDPAHRAAQERSRQ